MSAAPASAFRFDAAEHAYWLGARRLPSVTDVIRAHGLVEERWFSEEARARGSYVHRACALLDEGSLDEERVAPEFAPYVEAWRRCRADLAPAWRAIERPVAALGFAGTPDRVGVVDGAPAIVDIKTSERAELWWELQLGGYAALCAMPPAARLLSVQLRADARYLVRIVDFARAAAGWRAAFALYQWRTLR